MSVKKKVEKLNKWQKLALVLGAVVVLGLLLHFGIDPAQDFVSLND